MHPQVIARGTQFSQLESGTTVTSANDQSVVKGSGNILTESGSIDGNAQEAGPRSGWIRRLDGLRNTYPRAWRCYEWLRGPVPPVVLHPTALLDSADLSWRNHAMHISLGMETWWLKHTNMFRRKWLLTILSCAYIVGLAFISRANSFLTPAESFVGCTSTYWLKDGGCGLDGQACAPFTGPDFDFRCPGDCLSVTLANPRAVGAQEVVYRSLVVGGGDSNKTYRGDSWICPAAIQA